MSSPSTDDSNETGDAQETQFPDIGEVFEEKYRIEELLGRGGYANVYRATQLDLERDVAIKILSPNVRNIEASEENTGSAETRAVRFEREAKLVSQLRSPYTVTMHDYGRTDRRLLYMVLEYIDGITLDDAEFPMEPERVSKILRQVLKSLHEAHDKDLLHRDLKPANIMLYEHLGEENKVKLLDFGIAKLLGEGAADRVQNEDDITGDSSLLGTPRYMSPEQIRGDDVGPPRDIYSLGLIAYEMVTGEKPIEEDDSIKIMAKHISDEPLRTPRHECDSALAEIVDRMLAKRLGDRYGDVREVIDDLQQYERDHQVDSSRDSATHRTVRSDSGPGDASSPPTVENSRAGSSKVGLFLGVVVVIFLLAGVGALLVMNYRGSSENSAVVLGGEQAGNIPTSRAESSGVATAGTPGVEADGEEARSISDPDTAASDDRDGDTGASLRITSTPQGAEILIEGRSLGNTPLDVDAFGIDYPTEITARHEGRERVRTVHDPREQLDFDIEDDSADGGRAESTSTSRQEQTTGSASPSP